MKCFISCEHGGNIVPAPYSIYFEGREVFLESHRGWDPGALELYSLIQNKHTYFAHYSVITRLLVDLNRGTGNRSLFSEFTKTLPAAEKQEILNLYYHPFRERFSVYAKACLQSGHSIFHLSVHTFVPVLNGVTRNGDIGILFDPASILEKEIAHLFKRELHSLLPGFKIRFNYPYLGKSDGHVTSLRRMLGSKVYAGIELELNSLHSRQNQVMQNIARAYNRLCELLPGR